jgi:hypothetical protein
MNRLVTAKRRAAGPILGAGSILLLLLVGCSAGAHEPPQEDAAHDTTVTADTIPPATVTPDTVHTAAQPPLSDYHLRRFRERGLDDPLRDIPADLEGRPELIPDEPVLGGTMRFTRIVLLTDRWALATYEDGHIQGHAILEYVVEEDAEIRWTVVAHYVD